MQSLSRTYQKLEAAWTPKLRPDVSVVIVSMNTRAVLRECLTTLELGRRTSPIEVFVVDNASTDGSPEMVEREFPGVQLVRSHTNLGFGPANNIAVERATGRYVVLLNSDAFLNPSTLDRAVAHMDENANVGIGGARLIGRNGSWQPCARMFPSPLNYILTMCGLSYRFPKSRFFGRFDRSWAPMEFSAEVDWVVGAFMIVRTEVFQAAGFFDPSFFLYYEEADLCRRARKAGFAIHYWADLQVVHACGESSKKVANLNFCEFSSQLTGWSMRCALLYFRKHHGWQARLIFHIETSWHLLRARYHAARSGHGAQRKIDQSRSMVRLMRQAWRETNGGRTSPIQPW